MACEQCELLSQLNGQTVDYYASKIYYPYWRFSAASTQRGTAPLSSWNFKGGAYLSLKSESWGSPIAPSCLRKVGQ